MKKQVLCICLLLFCLFPLNAIDEEDLPITSKNYAQKVFTKHLQHLDPIEGIYELTKNCIVSVPGYKTERLKKTYVCAIFSLQNDDNETIFLVQEISTRDIIGAIKRISDTQYYKWIASKSEHTFKQVDLFSFNVSWNDFYQGASSQNSCYAIKSFPTSSMYQEVVIKAAEEKRKEQEKSKPTEWSGSGFALRDCYIITNYHVVDGANTITIKGIKGDFNIAYSASLEAYDKNTDLALLKINDNNFTGFGTPPYSVKTTTSEVGEEIFVLGYPLTATMGDEIKYTTGVISSKTGFQGDVSLYQISAPVQPGNSGGPLFDSQGTLIGVVSAKHQDAENVGYAIKTSYLRNLIESYTASSVLPTNNTILSLSRPEKIKSIKKFVFIIECSSSISSK